MKGVYQLGTNNPEDDGLAIFYSTCSVYVLTLFETTDSTCSLCFDGFFNEKRKKLKKAAIGAGKTFKKFSQIKGNELMVIEWLIANQPEAGRLYLQLTGSLKKAAHSLNEIADSFAHHVYNSHKPFNDQQAKEFDLFRNRFSKFINAGIAVMEHEHENKVDDFSDLHTGLLSELQKMSKNQVSRISCNEVSRRNSLLFFDFIKEMEKLINALCQVVNINSELQACSYPEVKEEVFAAR